jgi:glycosyltransferase involved in cell wall biosynthesis
VLEPYYGGSHRAALDALLGAVEWDADLLTLPARKWKWRMRGAAITMAEQVRELAEAGERWDLLLCSTFLNLAEFKGLAGRTVADVPSIVYFHENQLVYPARHEREWDFHFPLANITSALAADRCLFNTRFNLEGFLEEIPGFLARFPDHIPSGVAGAVAERSEVLPPPFDPAPFDRVAPSRGERCRIVWPHRWEHDKAPQDFFEVVRQLAAEGLEFEVVVAGQAFGDTRESFERAAAPLGERVVHLGEPEDLDSYARLLASSDVAVSTAVNEFFGLAMMEAAYAGCRPLVPDRLCYPELYPDEMRYEGPDRLHAELRSLVLDRPEPGAARGIAEAYTVETLAPRFDARFHDVAGTVA